MICITDLPLYLFNIPLIIYSICIDPVCSHDLRITSHPWQVVSSYEDPFRIPATVAPAPGTTMRPTFQPEVGPMGWRRLHF